MRGASCLDPAPLRRRDLNVIDIPSFIFFRGGREVHRYAGSSRGEFSTGGVERRVLLTLASLHIVTILLSLPSGDLLGQVLSLSPVVPPPPPGQVGRGRAKRQS